MSSGATHRRDGAARRSRCTSPACARRSGRRSTPAHAIAGLRTRASTPGLLDLDAFTALAGRHVPRKPAARAAEPPFAPHSRSGVGATGRPREGAVAVAAPRPSSRSSAVDARGSDRCRPRARPPCRPGLTSWSALVVAHPYRERFRAQQMLALYRSGRRPTRSPRTGLRAIRSSRTSGSSPGRVEGLERRVLDQDPALAAPPGEAATPLAGAPRRRRRVRTAMLVGLAVATVAVVAALREEAAPAPSRRRTRWP